MAVPKLRFKADNGSEFPEWEEKMLGDVGAVAMCKRVFKEQTSDTGEVPFFKIGTFGGKPDAYISYALFKELKEKYPYPKKGTVLLSASGTVGRQVMYNGENAYYQDSNIVWLEHDGTVIDGFLNQFYSIVKWKGLEGSTIKRLYNKTILDTVFYRPSLPEQKKIAAFLSTIDEIITTTQSELTAWEERKRGVMQKIFSREVRFKADDGSEFPEWEEKKFGDVFENMNNNTYSRECLNYSVGVVKNIHYGDILVKFGACVDVGNEDIPYINEGLNFEKYNRLENGDIVIADTAEDDTVGKAVEIENNNHLDVVAGLHTIACRPKYEFAARYLGYYLNSDAYHFQLRPYMQGIKVTSISKTNIQLTTIQIPSLPEQKKIADCLSSLDDVINQIQAELSAWKEFKKGLMQQMFV